MTEPTIKIDGDEISIGNFTVSDHDIAEYLDKEIEANRGVLVRDAVFIGLKVFLNERISLATDTILEKVENRINEILTDPGLQDEGSPFGEILNEITELKKALSQQAAKREFSSKAKGDAYEDFIEALLIEEFGHTANVVKTGAQRAAAGFLPHEIGVFVRSDAQIPRATAALERTSLAYRVLDQKVTSATGYVSVATMHLAKGLEFRGVAVMACDDEIVPLQERLQEVGDDADLKYVYETERHLLYVACTRARDELLITAVSPESEFLVDLTRKR